MTDKETLEEARANSYIDFAKSNEDVSAYSFVSGWDKGAKWQQEQDNKMYSEEEVKQIIELTLIEYSDFVLADIPHWFEQFKKK